MKIYDRIGAFKGGLLAATASFLIAICAPAHAGLVGYQSLATFNAAISGWTKITTDFESIAAGTTFIAGTGPAGSGFTITLSGPDALTQVPMVADQFWTTSGLHYLGLDNADTALEAGDSLTFSFGTAVQAFGLYVIGGGDVGAGDVGLTTGISSISNSAVPDLTDGLGSFAYFLGFASDDASTFSSVTLNDLDLASARLLAVSVDDVVLAQNNGTNQVPEPGTLALMLSALLLLGVSVRHRNL